MQGGADRRDPAARLEASPHVAHAPLHLRRKDVHRLQRLARLPLLHKPVVPRGAPLHEEGA